MFVSIIAVIIVLSVVIFVHEFGHFFAAKKIGTKVEEFGFGLPPRIYGIKKGDTTYSINWIPFGGFVKIKGETADDKQIDQDSLLSKKIWQRALVMSAGIVMNLVLAVVLMSVSFMIGVPADVDGIGPNAQVTDERIQVLALEKEMPAEAAGLQTADKILSIDGQRFTNIEEINNYNKDKFDQEITLEIERDQEVISTNLVLAGITDEDGTKRAVMGVSLLEVGTVRYPILQSIWYGIKYTYTFLLLIAVFLYNLVKDLIAGQPVGDAVTGPIGVAFLTSKVVKLGFSYIMQFVAIISINLAVFNLIPFPALDGSKLVFLGIEKIRRKRVSLKVENGFHTVGFVMLIILAVVVAIKDWQRFFG